MKIRARYSTHQSRGMAVIALIALIAIVLIFVAGNLRTLHLLRTDLRLIETQQTNRLATTGVWSNTARALNTSTNAAQPHTPERRPDR